MEAVNVLSSTTMAEATIGTSSDDAVSNHISAWNAQLAAIPEDIKLQEEATIRLFIDSLRPEYVRKHVQASHPQSLAAAQAATLDVMEQVRKAQAIVDCVEPRRHPTIASRGNEPKLKRAHQQEPHASAAPQEAEERQIASPSAAGHRWNGKRRSTWLLPNKTTKRTINATETRLCRHCGQVGHIQRNCPQMGHHVTSQGSWGAAPYKRERGDNGDRTAQPQKMNAIGRIVKSTGNTRRAYPATVQQHARSTTEKPVRLLFSRDGQLSQQSLQVVTSHDLLEPKEQRTATTAVKTIAKCDEASGSVAAAYPLRTTASIDEFVDTVAISDEAPKPPIREDREETRITKKGQGTSLYSRGDGRPFIAIQLHGQDPDPTWTGNLNGGRVSSWANTDVVNVRHNQKPR